MANDRNEQRKMRGTKRRFARGTQDTEPANWDLANPELLREAIRIVAHDGGALRLGYSRDGGAYAIGVYGDGDPYTEYVRPGEDINQVLLSLIDAFDGDTAIGSKLTST